MKNFILIGGSLTVISYVFLLHCFPLLLSCCSIHILLLASFPFTQPKAKSFYRGPHFNLGLGHTQPPKKHMPKHAHIRYHSLPRNPSHLTILEGNAQAKPLGFEFQIPQVLCKSIKSVRIGPKSSWLNHSHEIYLHIYIYIYICVCVCVCVC